MNSAVWPESSQCFGYVSWHGQVDRFLFVVPVQVDATIELALPVNVDLVVLVESMLEVFGMRQADGF